MSFTQVLSKLVISSADSVFSVAELLTEEYYGFELLDEQSSIEGIGADTTTKVIIRANPHLKKYDRVAYSLLDYLRDIGGLFGAFNALFTGIVYFFNFNGLYQWLTSMLFRVQCVSLVQDQQRWEQTRDKSEMEKRLAHRLSRIVG